MMHQLSEVTGTYDAVLVLANHDVIHVLVD